MADVRFTGVQLSDFDRVYIESHDGEMLFGETQDQREADVAESNNADSRSMCLNFL